ncbi:hypothetical protein [Stenotrophomonas acidaminiphila]
MQVLDLFLIHRVVEDFDAGASGLLAAGNELIPVVVMSEMSISDPDHRAKPTEHRRVTLMISAAAVVTNNRECLDLMTVP